jgi:ribonuclease HII
LRIIISTDKQIITLLKCYYKEGVYEAGCDEAGRGCLAGPVFAAAVILPLNFENPLLNDSKQVSAYVRNQLRLIIEREAVSWAVAWVDNKQIDEINILKASILAMHKALDNLKTCPEHILVDGNRFFPYRDVAHRCIVKGDATYASIAAASILAKTCRDEYMISLHNQFEHYGWDRNKGYPTSEHRVAIARYGITPYHRKSFSLFSNQLQLIF